MEAKRVDKQLEQGIGSHQLSVGRPGPQVYLRLRPPKTPTVSTTYTVGKDGTELVTTSRGNRSEKHFGFTSIFDCSVDQSGIYEGCVGPHVKAEQSMTIVMYGTSGSGKTHTLLGNDESAGIIPRALNNIFTNCRDRIQQLPVLKLIRGTITPLQDRDLQREIEVRKYILELCPSLGNTTPLEGLGLSPNKEHDLKESVLIWISYVEIHNELVYDLLAMPSQRFQKLQIMHNNAEPFVNGLTSVYVTGVEDALRLLRLGRERSACASTRVNDRSSRSHCVFTLDMLRCNKSGLTTRSSFKFCDLAGSERVSTSGSTGQRFEETKNINKSLVVLGRCLGAACSNSRGTGKPVVIPHRDSKLTLLLHTAMLGKEKLIMIATVAPVDNYYEENQNVLTFAAIAKNIIFPEPVAKQRVLSNPTAGSSEEYAKQLKCDRARWENKTFRMKRRLLLSLHEIQMSSAYCELELWAAHAIANKDVSENMEELKVKMISIMKQVETLNNIMGVSSDQK